MLYYYVYIECYILISGTMKITNNHGWKENIQAIVGNQNDVQILCTSASGVVVRCHTSSLLLTAYSSVLRQQHDAAPTILCQDFSQDSVQIALEFLAFGESVELSHSLATEIHSLFKVYFAYLYQK